MACISGFLPLCLFFAGFQWSNRSLFLNCHSSHCLRNCVLLCIAVYLPGVQVATQLMKAIREKCTPEEAAALLAELPNPLQDEDGDARLNPLKIDVFVQTLLFLASKSFSHAFAAISKFHIVFKVRK